MIDYKILYINTNFFFEKNRDFAIKRLFEYKFDILVLNEVRKDSTDYVILENELRDYFGNVISEYKIAKNGEFLLLSKLEIEKSELGVYEGFQYAEIVINNSLYSIYNIHLMPYFVSRPHFHFHETDVSGMGVKELKKLQFDALKKLISENNNPNKILIGDFNSFWFDKVIRYMSKSFSALNPKAKLNKATFPSNFPILRMDYCFVNENIKDEFSVYYIRDDELSDHLMIEISTK